MSANIALFNPLMLSDEQFETIASLSALNYTKSQMALYLELDYAQFLKAFNSKDSKIAFYITAGKLQSRFLANDKLLLNAQAGNITAHQELQKITNLHEVEQIKRKILFYEED